MEEEKTHLLSTEIIRSDEVEIYSVSESQDTTKPTKLRLITIEPSLIFYFLAYVPSLQLLDQYILARLEKEQNFTKNTNTSECYVNTTDPDYILEQELQAEASLWTVRIYMATLVPAFISTIMIGSYSDQVGRRIALIIPSFSAVIKSTLFCLVFAYDLPFGVLLIGAFYDGVFGTTSTIVTGGMAYIADITTHKNRSIRLVILDLCFGAGRVLSQIAFGFFIDGLGFLWPMITITILYVISFLYSAFLLPESLAEKKPRPKFFTLEHFKKAAKPFIIQNPANTRWKIQLATVILFLSMLVELGTDDTITLFLLNSPLCFTATLVGAFFGVSYFIRYAGTIIFAALMQACVGDIGLSIFGAVSGAIYCLVIGTASTRLVVFLSPLVGITSMLIPPMMRSQVSKAISSNIQGSTMASLAWVQILSALLGSIIFNNIYRATLLIDHSATFITMAAIYCVALVLLIIFLVKMRKERGHHVISERIVGISDYQRA